MSSIHFIQTMSSTHNQSGWRFELPSSQPVVSLGTLPLRSLYTVFDADAGRVGLAQKGDDASLRETGDAVSDGTPPPPTVFCFCLQRQNVSTTF